MKNEEEYYIKNNICPFCEGKIYFETRNTKLKNLNGVKCTCEDGTYIGYSLFETEMAKRSHEQLEKRYKELQNWSKKSSQCKTCGGDQWKTFGLMTCEECGIPGIGYWPA